MELPPDLLPWLSSTQLFQHLSLTDETNTHLSSEFLEGLSSGVFFTSLLRSLRPVQPNSPESQLIPPPVTETTTVPPPSLDEKLETWVSLKLFFSDFGIQLTPESINKIATQDSQAIIEVLMQIKAAKEKLALEDKPEKKGTGVFLETMDTEKPLFQADSCIEFFILSFCANFSLKPKQAAGLLTKNNEILARVIAKGLRGDFDPVIGWLQSIYQNTERLSDLMQSESEKNSLSFALACLRPGLLSKNIDILQWTCKVFSRLALDLEERGALQAIWTWFIGDKGCLELMLKVCKQPEITAVAVEMMLHVSQFNLIQLFSLHLKDILSDPMLYFSFVNDILPTLHETEWVRDEILSSRILHYWLESGLREADAYTSQARMSVMLFLSNLWTYFFCSMEESDTVLSLIIGSLKNCFRDHQVLVRTTALSVTMELLDHLILVKHGGAAMVFKVLNLMYIEMDPNEQGREIMTLNVVRLLTNVQSLPISLMVEPLVKRINSSQSEYPLDLTDFSLFAAMSEHPRLLIQDAIQLADLLGKVYMSEIVFSRAVLPAFCILIARFIEAEAMQEYLSIYIKYIITQALNAQQNIQSLVRKLGKAQDPEEQRQEILVLRRVRDLAFEIVSWVLQLQSQDLNAHIKEILVTSALDYQSVHKAECKGLLLLLEEFGDPYELIQLAEQERAPVVDLINTDHLSISPSESLPSEPDLQIVPVSEAIQPLPKKLPFPWKRAFADISQAKERAKRRLQQLEDQNSSARKWLEVRKPMSEGKKTPSFASVLSDGPVPRFVSSSVDPFQFQELSKSDQSLVDAFLRKWHKLLKTLFQNYAATGFSRKKEGVSNFDVLGKRKSLMSESELIKMFADHNLVPRLISKEEIRGGIKGYCAQILRKSEAHELDFSGFLYCFCQFAYTIFTTDPQDYAHLPPVVSLQGLLTAFRAQTKAMNLSTDLYDNPSPGAGDKDLAKKLTEELKSDPDFVLPQGYMKVTDQDFRFVFKVPNLIQIPKANSVALEIMDEILFSALEIHTLETQVEFFPVNRAFGVAQKKEHVDLPPIYERRQSEFRQKIKSHVEESNVGRRAKVASGLSPVLKLEVAKSSETDRPVYHECALLLSDILHSVGLNTTKVVTRDQGKLRKAVSIPEPYNNLERDKSKNKEQWKVRKQRMVTQMQEVMERREKEKADEAEIRRKKQEVEDKKWKLIAEKIRKEKEDRDRLFKQYHEQKDAEDRKRKDEEIKVKSVLDEKTKKIREELKRKMNEKLKEAITKRHQDWQQRTEVPADKGLLEELDRHKKQYSRIIKEDRKRLAEKEQHQQIFRTFSTAPEVTELVSKYKKHLELLFSLYCKQSLAKVEHDPTNSFQMMKLLDFSKFTSQFGVTPVLVGSDVVLAVFNSLTKMKLREAGVPATLTYEDFLSALLRFVDLGRTHLNRLAGTEPTDLTAATLDSFCTYLGCSMPLKDFHEKIKRLQMEHKHHRKLRTSDLNVAKTEESKVSEVSSAS